MAKFIIGQCLERNGNPKLAGQIYNISDTLYYLHLFGKQDTTSYIAAYSISITEKYFHEVQCVDPMHEWSTPRPLPGAHGQLESLAYPASVKHGDDVRVFFRIHNTGGQSGTFISRLYQGTTMVGSWRTTVPAGKYTGGTITPKAPSSGSSVSYTLKLFLET